MNIKLTKKQLFITERLEELFNQWDIPRSPKKMFEGALFIMQPNLRNNPDWMSQSANSFREIFYHLLDKNRYSEFKKGTDKKQVAFESYGSINIPSKDKGNIGFLFNRFTEIAHHSINLSVPSSSEYEDLVTNLENELYSLLTRQLDVHKKIEKLISDITITDNTQDIVQEIKNLIISNLDSCQYFFSHVTAESLPILIREGFYNDFHWSKTFHNADKWISDELLSLERLVTDVPEIIANLFLNHKLKNDTYPFSTRTSILRCIKSFSKENTRQTLEYLSTNGWDLPTKRYSDDYIIEDLEKKLIKTRDWVTFLILVEYRFSPLVLGAERTSSSYSREYNPFVFDTQFCKKTFEGLGQVPYKFQKQSLDILQGIFKQTLTVENKTLSSDFEFDDTVLFMSSDLTKLSFEDVQSDYDLGIMDKLIVTYLHIAKKFISDKRTPKKLIDAVINKLQDSPVLWKIKYILLSLVITKFETQFVNETLKFTKHNYPYDYLSGTEYKVTLSRVYNLLNSKSKSLIFKSFINYFKENNDNSEVEIFANPLFSVINKDLDTEQLEELLSIGVNIIDGYTPSPSMGKITAGVVVDKSPVDIEELSSISVKKIIINLKSKWHPNEILKTSKSDSFLSPINASGLAQLISTDLNNRPIEYLPELNGFLEPQKIGLVFTYRILDGISQFIKINNSISKFETIVDFISSIAKLESEGELLDIKFDESTFHRSKYDYVTNLSILNRVNDVIKKLIDNELFISSELNAGTIKKLRNTIELLLKHKNPDVSGEEFGTATSTIRVGGEEPKVSDSYTQAINSVRGVAFTSYIYLLRKTEKKYIEDDSRYPKWKYTIENIIKSDNTRALHFLFGKNTAHLISLDKEWYYKTFSFLWDNSLPYHLQLQIWNGFLHTQPWIEYLSKDLIKNSYFHWIKNPPKPETDRKYFKNFDHALSSHFFSYYIINPEEFRNSNLFKEFFENSPLETHTNFIDLIGRYVISKINEVDVDEWNKELGQSIFLLWNQYLDEYPNDELFEHFSYWYSDVDDLIDIEQYLNLIIRTLKRSSGKIFSSHVLLEKIIKYAEVDLVKAIKITELVMFDGWIKNSDKQHTYINNKWKELFRYFYNSEQKVKTKSLVSRLIHEGGSPFWVLKENEIFK